MCANSRVSLWRQCSPSVDTSETSQGSGGLGVPVPASHYQISTNPCIQPGEGELQNKPQIFCVNPANAWKEITRPSLCDGWGDAECEWLKLQGASVGIWHDKFDRRLSGVTESNLLRECPFLCLCSPWVMRMQGQISQHGGSAFWASAACSVCGPCCRAGAAPCPSTQLLPNTCTRYNTTHPPSIFQHLHEASIFFFFFFSLKREDFISDMCWAKTLDLCFIPCDGFLSCGGTKSPMYGVALQLQALFRVSRRTLRNHQSFLKPCNRHLQGIST